VRQILLTSIGFLVSAATGCGSEELPARHAVNLDQITPANASTVRIAPQIECVETTPTSPTSLAVTIRCDLRPEEVVGGLDWRGFSASLACSEHSGRQAQWRFVLPQEQANDAVFKIFRRATSGKGWTAGWWLNVGDFVGDCRPCEVTLDSLSVGTTFWYGSESSAEPGG
jgi:hypothetical protein